MTAPLGASDLAARPAAALAVVGSRLVEEHGIDEGVGHGFAGNDRSALLRRWWKVDAPPGAILDWFDEQLVLGGWVAVQREDGSALFLRGSEQLFLAIRSTEGGTVTYEVGYSDQTAR